MKIPEAIEHEKRLLSGMWLKDGKMIPDVAEILVADDFICHDSVDYQFFQDVPRGVFINGRLSL